MSMYLEIPEFESEFRFRTFLNDGLTIVYPMSIKKSRSFTLSAARSILVLTIRSLSWRKGICIFFQRATPLFSSIA